MAARLRWPAQLGAAALALTLAGAALAQPSSTKDAEARGLVLVQRNCAMCHAIGVTGDSPNPQAPHFRDLNQRYPVENLGEALAEGILVGHPQMPELKFSGDEVSDIIAYLESIQTNRHARAGAMARPLG